MGDDTSTNHPAAEQTLGAIRREANMGDSPPYVSEFGPVELPESNDEEEPKPIDDQQLGHAIARGSKLDHAESSDEIYPPALKLGGSAWIPSIYWGADYRRRLERDALDDLQDQRPLRNRGDAQGARRSGLMLDTVFLALEDPAEER
ncbi:MAG: hypothetical protein QOF85_1409 [Solirubrobacterales bacterium]|jgi:hypothetical protein|nr:hypothetical protein [Solirubrobacterales bacterium]